MCRCILTTEQENSTNLDVMSHLLTPVTTPTGLEGQQSTEFSQLGGCMPPHSIAPSTVCKAHVTVGRSPEAMGNISRNSHETQGDYLFPPVVK